MPQLIRLLPLCVLVLLGACSKPDSPEAQIRKTIDAMEAAAEARDASDVMEFVAAEFRDGYGQDRDQLRKYLYGYFLANQSLHLLTRVDDIELLSADEARLSVTVGVVSREADAASAWNLAAEVRDFDLTMRKLDGRWQVTHAKRGNR